MIWQFSFQNLVAYPKLQSKQRINEIRKNQKFFNELKGICEQIQPHNVWFWSIW